MYVPQVLPALFKELLLWLFLPALFVAYYVVVRSNPVASGTTHLLLISHLAIFVFTLNGLISTIIKSKKTVGLVVSFIYATCIFSMLFYYILVYVGLNTWGRVITVELMLSYANQLEALCDALGLSYLTIQFILLVIFVSAWFLLYLYVYNAKLITYLQHKLQLIASYWVQVLVSITFCILALYPMIDYPADTLKYADYMEPIILTFWAGKPENAKKSATQGNRYNKDLNEQELKAVSNYRANDPFKKSNVILIVVDALRPSNMGIYGYLRQTTPYLYQLKDVSAITTVSQVSASCAESACGLMSIASSRFIHLMPETPFTLQQVLKRHGYKTRLILSGDHTNFYNLKNLYGPVDSYFDASMSKRSNYYANDDSIIVDETNQLPEWDRTPVMFQFILMSAQPMRKRQPMSHKYIPMKNYNGMTHGAARTEYTNFYDNGVVQTDATIKRLLQTLESKHYLDDAIVVITADHGEALGEHQLYSHANGVFEEQLKIPLIFISTVPSQSKIKPIKKIVSQVDIAPSILYELGMNIPQNWNGTPVQLSFEPKFTYFHLHFEEGLYDYRQQGHHFKYWVNMQNGKEFVYNISIDPSEKNNIINTISPTLKKTWRMQLSKQY